MQPDILQDRISRGMGRAARHLGALHDLYRPNGASNPLDPANRRLRFNASFNAQNPGYDKPNGYGAPFWFGVFDSAFAQPGDYITGPSGTFFIAAQQPLLPVLCVQANATLTIARPSTPDQSGATGYGGITPTSLTSLLTGWPASLLAHGGGEAGILPTDATIPYWSVLLPPLPIPLRGADIVTDDSQRSFVISAAEQSALGWRLTIKQTST